MIICKSYIRPRILSSYSDKNSRTKSWLPIPAIAYPINSVTTNPIFVINIIMDSSSLASFFSDPHPQISHILTRVRQLAGEDEWIKDYYHNNSSSPTSGNFLSTQNSPSTIRRSSTIMSSGRFISPTKWSYLRSRSSQVLTRSGVPISNTWKP